MNKLAESLQGIAVWGCLPGSRAQRMGLRYGDVLLSVNGVRTSNMADYLQARELRSDVVQLVIFRDGAEMAVDIELDPEQRREPTREEIEAVAKDVVAARLMPTERPPPPDLDQV
ncbi:MAG TPA: PDZ domain-containing protein [Polyangiaceae bacterium]|nr:PDZ domain-containing protein [Polyangiaceae bacterium]